MMSKDRSLEDIDLVKLLLFSLVFVITTLIIVFGLIVPDIKKYKDIKLEYKNDEASYMKVKNHYNQISQELDNAKNENKRILGSFKHLFNEQRFINYSKKFFHDVNLSKVAQEESMQNFSTYQLQVSTAFDTPTNLYEFLEKLKPYENIIKVDYPIELNSQGLLIKARLNIKVYNQKD